MTPGHALAQDRVGLISIGYRLNHQYLSDAKNPHGYCPDHGTGVSCPVGVVKAGD